MSINTKDAKNIRLSEKLRALFLSYAQVKSDKSKIEAELKKVDTPLKEFIKKQVSDKKLLLSQVYISKDIVFRLKDNGNNIQLNTDLLNEFLKKHGKNIEDFKIDKGQKQPTLEVEILI